MPVELRIVESVPDFDDRVPGMMWREPQGDVDGLECWAIQLPDTDPRIGTPGHPSKWGMHWRTTDRPGKPPHDRWSVSGTPPLITVTPSIDVECWVRGPNGESVRDGSYWHGFIINGVMTP